MATYGLKYYCDYRSKMRDRLLYRIEIEERGNANTSETYAAMMRPYADVFTLKQGGTDDPEYTAIKGCSLTLKILCVDDMEYLSLFTTDPRKYRITIYKYQNDDPASPSKTMLWRGFLAANSYKEEFAHPPYVVTLSATDGLSLLGAMPFRDAKGAKYTGTISAYDLLQEAIESLELDLPVCEWLNLESDDSTAPSLKSVYVDRARIYGMYEDPTWLNALEICVQSFGGQIFQADGVFHVRRIISLRGQVRPAAFFKTKNRPVLHDMWHKSCDANTSNDLNLLAPYKYAEVKTPSVDHNLGLEEYYNGNNWVDRQNIAGFLSVGHRIIVYGAGVSNISLKIPFKITPVNSINLEFSFDLYNLVTVDSVIGEIAVLLKSQSHSYKWDESSGSWVESVGEFKYNYSVDASAGKGNYLYPYTAFNKLKSSTLKTTITTFPDDYRNEDYQLYIRLVMQPSRLSVAGAYGFTHVIVSNISIDASLGENSIDPYSSKISVSSLNSDKCSWDVPIRDGGYNANAEAVLPNVLADSAGAPIVSWVSRTERGFIMDMLADDIRRLRANVDRQLGGGELRCPFAVDLNSLFRDWLFTKAIYYVNSWELIASRQVYKVQLRELIDMNHVLKPLELAHIRTFTNNERIFAALHSTLFLRTGNAPYGIELFDTETRAVTELPYRSDKLNIRKGFNAVVLQVGDTDLYAVDNVGEVLSHLDSNTTDVLKYDTALYDAARKVWVSYDATSEAGKVTVTVFTDAFELESQDTFDVAATGMSLMANGYLIHTASNTYWHNYELHPADVLLAIDDKSNPMTAAPVETLAVSDSLIVLKDITALRAPTSVRRRVGGELKFTETLYILSEGAGPIVTADANSSIAVAKIDADSMSYLSAYDLRSKKHCRIEIDRNSDVAVCGANVCVMSYEAGGSRLSVVPFEDSVGLIEMPEDSIQFRIKVVDAVTGNAIPDIRIVVSHNNVDLGSLHTDHDGEAIWNYEKSADAWEDSFAGTQMQFTMKHAEPLTLVDSLGRVLLDSNGRTLKVPAGKEIYFEASASVVLKHFSVSVKDGYGLKMRLIKKSDFVLTPTTVELPVIGGRRELTVSPGLFPIKRWNGAEWLVSTMQGYGGIALSAEATEYERDTAAEFGPDAYGCLGRCSVAVHQDGTALVSRPINFRLSILDEQGAPVSADQTHIYWQGADGTKRHIGFAYYDVIETVLDGASVLAFNLEVTASEPGFKTFTTEIPIPAGTDEYSWEGSVTLRKSRRNLVLDFSVVNENDTLIEDAEVLVFYTDESGEETTYGARQGRVQATVPDVTTDAFPLGIAAARDGYDVYENIIQVPAGSEDYSYTTDVKLTPVAAQSRNLVLNLSIQNAEGAAVDAQSVEVRYTKPDGTEGTLTTSGSHITDTIPNVTTAYFTATITVQTEGYQLWRGPVSVLAGTDDATVEKTVTLTGSIQSRPLKLHVQVAGSDGTPLVADEVTASYIQPSGTSKQEHWANTGEVDVTLEASTGHMTMGLAALKSGYESGKKLLDIPAGSTQYDINETLTLTSSEPTPKRRLILQLAFENLNGDAVAVDKVTVSTKDAAGGTMTREYTNVTAVDDTLDDIPTSDSSVTVTAVKSGFTDVRMTRPIPAGESDYTYTDTITIGAERLFSAELHVTDKAGQPVVADEITFTWRSSTGTTNTERRENTSSLIYGPVSNCTAEAFTMNITAKAAGYNSIEDHIDVPAGTEAYTAQKTIQLAPGSRNAVLNFTVSDKDGAPISGVGVGFRYVNADGEEDSYMADTDASGRISATVNNVTLQSFDALVIAYLDGWRLYSREFTVPAGTEDYTYDRNITLYDSYDPLVTFSRELPWPSIGTMIAMHNSGNVALTLVSMPAWCQGTKDLPLDIPVEGGYTFAVVKNETGAARTGTLAMEYHNTETGETVAYNVEVTQEG